MGKYSGAAATALALITKKGGPVTLIRQTGTAFDPVTQSDVPSTQSYSLTAVALPGKKRSEDYQPGTLTKGLCVKFLFALKDAPTQPTVGDLVVYKGDRWTITDLNIVDPAGDGAIYSEASAEI